jgi:hypothetical protein
MSEDFTDTERLDFIEKSTALIEVESGRTSRVYLYNSSLGDIYRTRPRRTVRAAIDDAIQASNKNLKSNSTSQCLCKGTGIMPDGESFCNCPVGKEVSTVVVAKGRSDE